MSNRQRPIKIEAPQSPKVTTIQKLQEENRQLTQTVYRLQQALRGHLVWHEQQAQPPGNQRDPDNW